MITRDQMEVDFARLFDIYKYGSTVYSPLLFGVLTGKYNEGIPENTRLDVYKDNMFVQQIFEQFFGKENKEKYTAMLKELANISKELGCS